MQCTVDTGPLVRVGSLWIMRITITSTSSNSNTIGTRRMNSGVRRSKGGASRAEQRRVVRVENDDDAVLSNSENLRAIGWIQFDMNICRVMRCELQRRQAPAVAVACAVRWPGSEVANIRDESCENVSGTRDIAAPALCVACHGRESSDTSRGDDTLLEVKKKKKKRTKCNTHTTISMKLSK
jgi:hypothetical protein